MGWIAAETGRQTVSGWTGKQWCDRCDARVTARVTERECFRWPEEYEIVCRSSFAKVNIVFLIWLMFIFEGSIQIFRINLVSVIKCVTCQVRFWINYWLDKREQHSLFTWFYPAVFQQYFSSRGYANSYLCEMFAECAVSSDFKPCTCMDWYFTKQQCNSLLSSSPTH